MFAAVLFMTVAAQACVMPPPAALDQAMGRTLTSVRSGNAKALLAQMSSAGVAFGAQGGSVPYAALADQFAHRTGQYCDLFVCNGAAGRLNARFTGGKTMKTVDFARQRATVVLNGHGPGELDLGYAYSTRCQWELTSILAP